MNTYPAQYRVIRSQLIVTKPSGEVVSRDTMVSWDSKNNVIEITLIGESPLKGYTFGVTLPEINRTMQEGEWYGELPKV